MRREWAKSVAVAVTFALAIWVGSPGVRHVLAARYHAEDSFPISTFGMFSMRRPEQHRMTWVRALDAHGAVLGPVPSYVFNPGGMNQAMAHLKEVRPDRPARRNMMCRAIAKSVARHRSQKRVARIEIVDAHYVPEKVFGPQRDERPERESVLIACPIVRAEAPVEP